MEIFKLFGSILVDTDKAENSIQKTDEKALDLGKTLSKGAETAGKFGLALAGGAAAAGTAMLAVANDTAKTADEIDKASIRMGVSAEYFQELKYAAEQSGVEMSTFEKAAKKLEGTDINFDDAMASIYALGTEEERAAKAAEIFGESVAYNMAPMLQMSGEEMDEMTKRANDLGLVMSGDDVKAGVKFGDTMADITKSLKALGTQLGTALMPMVQKFADMVLAFLPNLMGIMDQLIPVVVQLAEAVLPPLMDLIEQILPVVLELITELMPFVSQIISELLPVFLSLIQTILPPLMEIIQTLLPILMTALDALMPVLELGLSLLKPILDLVLGLVSPLLEIVGTILEPITKLIDKLVKGPLSNLTPVLEGLSSILSDVIGTSIEYVMKKVELVTNVFSDLIDFVSSVFAGDWEKAWNAIVKTFGDIFTGIVELVKVPLNKIIELLNGAIDGFNAIQIPDWVPGVGGMGLNIPKIPKLANGGIVDEPGVVMVGERGPELLNLPSGASVSPLNNIDYDKMTTAFIRALREVAPELATNIRVEGNRDNLVEVLLVENQKSIYSTGRALFE